MKNIFNLLSVVMLLSATVKGQDPLYSNVCCDPLYLNPALTGSEKGLSANAAIRYQWPKITSEHAGATYAFAVASADSPGCMAKICAPGIPTCERREWTTRKVTQHYPKEVASPREKEVGPHTWGVKFVGQK